jgi:hypothetical protein
MDEQNTQKILAVKTWKKTCKWLPSKATKKKQGTVIEFIRNQVGLKAVT